MHNTATQNGAIHSRDQATVLLEEGCTIVFKDNRATESRGSLYLTANSIGVFTGHSKVTYFNNKVIQYNYEVIQYGRAIYCSDNTSITLEQNNFVEFTNNTSEYGGAISLYCHLKETVLRCLQTILQGEVGHFMGFCLV